MPRKLKRLSGQQVIGLLKRHGFDICATRGSHVKLRRVTADGLRQTLTIPNHRELDTGTLAAIFRQACKYVPDRLLEPDFFSD
ncbi:MAG: type II toxin-antitoxin system HicA family toxin [Candidatus Riflebacteria bacterium]|nr:type II toxin-antitoxin system HicA family toxin [Candidatus Riflebacteria bacterium]